MIFIHLAFCLIFILIKRLRTNLCVPDNTSTADYVSVMGVLSGTHGLDV
jgi:hypothetical protein